jgi:beta-N-acetylhexosaminidase
MFLFTRNLDEDVEYMRRGIATGVLTQARLHEALIRILAFKASLGLHRADGVVAPDEMSALRELNNPEHVAWAADVASSAITLVKDTAAILPLDVHRHRRVLLHDLHGGNGFFDSSDRGADRLLVELLIAEGFEVTRFEPTMEMEGEVSPTTDTTERYDLILYLARLATRSNQTTVRIEWAQPMGANVPMVMTSVPTVFVSVENPYHLIDVPRVPTYINTYNSSATTIRALVEKLMGRSPFTGVSPIDPFCGRWDAKV